MEACSSQYWEKAKGYINSWHFKYILPLPVNLWIWGKCIFPRMVTKRCSGPHGIAFYFLSLEQSHQGVHPLTAELDVCHQGWMFAPRMGVECTSEIKRGSGSAAQSSPCSHPLSPSKQPSMEQGEDGDRVSCTMQEIQVCILWPLSSDWLSCCSESPIPQQESHWETHRSNSLPGRVFTNNNGPGICHCSNKISYAG